MPAEDVPPATPPGTKGYYDQDPDGEWTAGFIDGLAIGRLEAIGEVRNRLAVHGLGINADARVGPVTEPDFTAPLPLRVPDNPLENPHYDEGLRAGCSRGFTDAVAELRSALPARGLHLDEDLSVAPLANHPLASRASERLAAPDPGRASREVPLTDAALHAFLDEAEASPSTFHPEPEPMLTLDPVCASVRLAPSTPAQTTDGTPEDPGAHHYAPSIGGAPSTGAAPRGRRRAVTRRGLLTGLVGASLAVCSALVGYFVRPKSSLAEPARTQVPSYRAPKAWSVLPPEERAILIALDEWVHTQEQAAQHATVHSVLQLVMSLPGAGYDELKQRVIEVIATAKRDAYVETVVLSGITASESAVDTRRLIYAMVDRCAMRGGHPALTSATRTRMELAVASFETDSHNIRIINALVPKLAALGL